MLLFAIGLIGSGVRAVPVLNGLVALPLLVLVMLVSNDRAAMGERTKGRLLTSSGGRQRSSWALPLSASS